MKVFILLTFLLRPAWADETATPLLYRNYIDSKFEFRKNCEEQKMECGSFAVPTVTSQELTIDTAFSHDSRSTRLFVVVCGTHGAEAPVGCALLNSLLTRQGQQIRDRGINMLFVHAANPYGFRFSRRVTEQNVDLNRNFLIGERPKNEGYQKLKANLEPEGQAGHTTFGFWKLSTKMIWRFSSLSR